MPNFEIIRARTGQLRSDQRRALLEVLGDGPTGTDQEHANRMLGEALIMLTEVLGYTAAQAWRICRPNSTATDESAAVLVRRRKAHHRKMYPLGINQALQVHGVTIEGVIEDIQAMRRACKWSWNEEAGARVETAEPDWRVRDKAIARLLQVVGLDKQVRDELAIGKQETEKMRLDTGRKFETTAEWVEYMKGREQEVIEARAQAAHDMKLIAEGRRIIQEEGQEAADKMREVALAHGEELH